MIRGGPMSGRPDPDPTAMDSFVEPTDWSTVPEPYNDPDQDPDAPVGDQ